MTLFSSERRRSEWKVPTKSDEKSWYGSSELTNSLKPSEDKSKWWGSAERLFRSDKPKRKTSLGKPKWWGSTEKIFRNDKDKAVPSFWRSNDLDLAADRVKDNLPYISPRCKQIENKFLDV